MSLVPLEHRFLLSGLAPLSGLGYTPAEITGAYGLSAITFRTSSGMTVKGDGQGETVALIEENHDPNIRADLHTFDQAYGLPDPSLVVVNQAGNRTNNTWALEESMDVEWAHAIAPAAKILVVEAAPSKFHTKELLNQLTAVDAARQAPNVVAISMSWGFIESAKKVSYDSYFTTPPGHTGITFIASSGDYGNSWYPSASPNVLSVGGTSLYLTGAGAYQAESSWFWSGGGYSPFEPEPAYQKSVQSTGRRSTPDVSFDADSSTGVSIYESSPRTGEGMWQVYGGTSLGAPAWAGIIAVVDQGRSLEGKGSLDGPTQTLPSLYSLPTSDFKGVTPFQGFLDTGGISSLIGDIFGPDSSGTTANISTGRGSPNGAALISDLVQSTVTTSSPNSGTIVPLGTALAHGSRTRAKHTKAGDSIDHSIGHDKRSARRHAARTSSGISHPIVW
jgi:subtilase family serine protease